MAPSTTQRDAGASVIIIDADSMRQLLASRTEPIFFMQLERVPGMPPNMKAFRLADANVGDQLADSLDEPAIIPALANEQSNANTQKHTTAVQENPDSDNARDSDDETISYYGELSMDADAGDHDGHSDGDDNNDDGDSGGADNSITPVGDGDEEQDEMHQN
ncbi:hypothetical protein E8E14_008370 [Neopestalotiopsis sp. 37M]|nr:hypothetical protein E8E14_008370 [Neopestalotiopsis sp. 37M]